MSTATRVHKGRSFPLLADLVLNGAFAAVVDLAWPSFPSPPPSVVAGLFQPDNVEGRTDGRGRRHESYGSADETDGEGEGELLPELIGSLKLGNVWVFVHQSFCPRWPMNKAHAGVIFFGFLVHANLALQ